MVVLAVVAGIAQQAVDGQVVNRLPDGIGKLWRVLTGPLTDHHRCEQIAVCLTDHRQLRPTGTEKPLVSDAVDVVLRDVTTFQTGGVDGCFGLLVDQATRFGNTENGGEKGIESPFFSNRLWA